MKINLPLGSIIIITSVPRVPENLQKSTTFFCGFSRTVLKFRQLYEVWKQEAKNWEKRRVEHLNGVTASIFTTFNLN